MSTATDLTIARADGRGEAIALATRAICYRCRPESGWGPAVYSPTQGWEHERPTERWNEAANDCRAAAIWGAIEAEGWV